MPVFEKMSRLQSVEGDDPNLVEVIDEWWRYSDYDMQRMAEGGSVRPTRLPDDMVPGLAKSISAHCGVRKVRLDEDGYSPIREDVEDYQEPSPPVPMSDEAKLALGLGSLALGGGLALAFWLSPKKKKKKKTTAKTTEDIDEVGERIDDITDRIDDLE